MAFLKKKELKWDHHNPNNPSSKGGQAMVFYKGQHKYYCGIDPHARKIYVGILDQAGKT
jgi:hypothetical protein